MKNAVRSLTVIIYLSVLFSLSALGIDADVKQAFEARTYKNKEGAFLNYRIYSPVDTAAKKKYPLVLFLHGAGERGDDNEKQLVHGAKDIWMYSKSVNDPVIIIAPQCPNGKQWVDVPWGSDSHVMPPEPSVPMKLTVELLNEAIKTMPVDQKRIYVTGLSMGGYGTWDIIQRYPKMFAAAMPVCGGGDAAQAATISRIPIWVFHGGNDNVVKTSRSRDMVEALKAAGGKPLYREYPNVGHNAWSATYSDKEVLAWFFGQKK